MSDNMYLYVISPLVAAVVGGVGYLVKHILSRRDKRHEEEIQERNKRRDEIEQRLTKAEQLQERTERRLEDAEKRFTRAISIVVGCDNPNCPTRPRLAEWLKGEGKEE